MSGRAAPESLSSGEFLCVCMFGYMHARNMFIRGTNTWLTGPPFLSWDRELYIMVRYRLGLGSF